MIHLYTDFGLNGPYVGQMKSLIGDAGLSCTDLMHDAPRFRPVHAGYLLAALHSHIPRGSIVIAVVDPGVGSDQRKPVIVECDQRIYVGPANELFNSLSQRYPNSQWHEITDLPDSVSNTFHGRDIFTPVAIRLQLGESISALAKPMPAPVPQDWSVELDEVIYVDDFKNIWTGLSRHPKGDGGKIVFKNKGIPFASTFSDMKPGELFWYVNSSSLIEIAANQGAASQLLKAQIGDRIEFE